jgi:hypothetical protein
LRLCSQCKLADQSVESVLNGTEGQPLVVSAALAQRCINVTADPSETAQRRTVRITPFGGGEQVVNRSDVFE